MRRFILVRIALGVITLIGVSILIFIAARLSGDVALLLAPQDATQAEIQEIRVRYGLDQPLPIQYFVFVKNALKGDFGRSIRYRQSAMPMVFGRLTATLELVLTAFVISILAGIALGTVSATRSGSWVDRIGKLFALCGQAMPSFWLGIMAILIFSVYLGWLPTSGRGGWRYLLMPAASIAWYSVASTLRVTRSAMLDVMDSEYIKLARLKGAPPRIVIWKHALRNALIPVIGLCGMQLSHMIGGAVIIESVFSWPGLGSLLVEAVYARDYPLIQSGVLVVATLIISINLIVDLLYGVIDPRIRYD